MRKLLVALIVIMLAAVVWIWRGRDLALLSEHFGTVEVRSDAVKSLSYEGSGKGGALHINDLSLDLTPANESKPVPEIGTSKDGQVALSYAGKVFSFAPPTAPDNIATAPAANDQAAIETRRSILAWPNPFETNFMTGNSPKWKRFSYRKLIWKKSGGSKLEIVWRCEQFYYQNNGWTDACMTDPGLTGLIRVAISSATQ